ncbi:YwqJ-related putative deaminase, partial [Streptomyces sp. NPDC101194]|uniref:YwqJ-related putative deaminase n=1 Tax=Streptomyces sp. NPDC101194 TaxID=3366127 RepID=UPI003820EC10
IAKGAGAGLSKIGDITKGIKGISNIEIPKLPDDAITLPEGSFKLPDGTVHLPEGAAIPEGGIKLPDGNVKFPDGAPVLPEGTTKLPTGPGEPARYFDQDCNLLDENGNVLQKAENAPSGHTPDTGADTPHTEPPSPAREPALVGAGAHTADNGAHAGADAGNNVIHLGDSLGNDLGDVGRAGDDLNGPTPHTGDNLPGSNADSRLPHGGVGDSMPTNHADDNLPGDSTNRGPGGPGDGHGHGPIAGHESPAHHTGGHGDGHGGPHDPAPAHHSDHTPNSHADDGAHHGAHDARDPHAEHLADDGLPHDVGAPHSDGEHSFDGSNHHDGDGPENQPQGTPLDPQPGWHGQSADQMRHYRRPALDVSHLPLKDQLSVLERESAALADDAFDATSGAAHPGQNQLNSGCAGSLLHDNVISSHSSTTKMHGQKLPKTHQVLDDILKDVGNKLDAAGMKKGLGHGKCAEVSLIGDRLHQLDPTGSSIRTIDDARKALEGSVMHTRQIGNVYDRATGELERAHGDFLAPCYTCRHVLPQLGIHVHS